MVRNELSSYCTVAGHLDSSNGYGVSKKLSIFELWLDMSKWSTRSTTDSGHTHDREVAEKALKALCLKQRYLHQGVYYALPCHRGQAQGLLEVPKVPNVTWKRFLLRIFQCFFSAIYRMRLAIENLTIAEVSVSSLWHIFWEKSLKSQVAKMDISKLRPSITELLWSRNWSPFIVDLPPINMEPKKHVTITKLFSGFMFDQIVFCSS